MTLKLFKTIIEALERGCSVKVKTRNSKDDWYSITPKGNYFQNKHPVLHCEDSMIDIQITEPKAPRYPTYEEVFQWFKEGKIFLLSSGNWYRKISMMYDKDPNIHKTGVIAIGNYTYSSIESFIDVNLDENGKSLMIQD